MRTWPAGRRRGALLLSAVLLFLAPVSASADDVAPAPETTAVEVVEPAPVEATAVEPTAVEPAPVLASATTFVAAVVPAEVTPEPATTEPAPSEPAPSDPAPSDPAPTEPAPAPTEPTAPAEPTPEPAPTDPVTTPAPEPTDPVTTPAPDPTDEPSTPVPTPTTPTSPTPTTPTTPTSPTPTPTRTPSTTTPTTTVLSTPLTTVSKLDRKATTSSRTSITTGGGEMMAALIQINTAEARCQANPKAKVPIVRIDSERIPASVGAFHDDQLVNAAIVMSVGLERGLPERAIVIAVLTAMGESDLRVLDEGEALGPDNAGLFQQGANGAWGSHADRVDPAIAAANFYDALVKVDGWEDMEPEAASNAVQRAPDETPYGEYLAAATEVVDRLSEGAVTASIEPCVTEYGALGDGSGSWVSPVVGRQTSSFGYRVHPVLGIAGAHTGTDIAAKCGTPVVAASDGIVVWSGGGIQGRTGNQVIVYHGDGQLTRYGHLLSGTVRVSVGDTVKAGDQIAGVGGDPRRDPIGAGNSTGCHLHFETNSNNGSTALDPVAFMKEHGVKLGGR